MNNVCIVLAAGKSERFGAPKMGYRLPSNKTILEQTVTQYIGHFKALTVVLKQNDAHLLELKKTVTKLPVEIELCALASKGMSQSLIAGLRRHADADAVMIALGDMPYVSTETIGRLKKEMARDSIVVPRYKGLAGNPVAFGQSFFPELMQISGDQGGKKIIAAHADAVVFVDTADRGVLQDIDTPEQVQPFQDD